MNLDQYGYQTSTIRITMPRKRNLIECLTASMSFGLILAMGLTDNIPAKAFPIPGIPNIPNIPNIPGIPGIPDIPIGIPDLNNLLERLTGEEDPITTNINDAVYQVPSLDSFHPSVFSPLDQMPRYQDGSFFILPGVYEFESQSYCLHTGTYGPQKGGPGYVFAPLKGTKSEVIRHILQRSVQHPEINQQSIQILIWAILARNKMNDLTPEIRHTAATLLTKDELSQLDKGALSDISQELIRQAIAHLPAPAQQVLITNAQLRSLLTEAGSTYQEIERIAVLTGSAPASSIVREIPEGRWSKHPDGYYIRFFFSGYWQTRIEVYVPEKNVALLNASPVILASHRSITSPKLEQYVKADLAGTAVPASFHQRIGQSGRKPKVAEADNAFTRAKEAVHKFSIYTELVPFSGGIHMGTEHLGTAIPLGLAKRGLGWEFDTWGKATDALSSDPPRSDYQVYARPESFPVKPIQAEKGVSQARATAINNLVESSLKVTALLNAALISQERFGGALQAEDDFWILEQGKATVYYKRQAGQAMLDTANRLEELINIMHNEEINDLYIASDMIRSFQANLRDRGWSSEAREVGQFLRLSEQDLEVSRQKILMSAPEELAGSFYKSAELTIQSLKEISAIWSRLPELPSASQVPG